MVPCLRMGCPRKGLGAGIEKGQTQLLVGSCFLSAKALLRCVLEMGGREPPQVAKEETLLQVVKTL